MRHSITVYSENCSRGGMPVPVGRPEEFGDESPDFVTYEWSSRRPGASSQPRSTSSPHASRKRSITCLWPSFRPVIFRASDGFYYCLRAGPDLPQSGAGVYPACVTVTPPGVFANVCFLRSVHLGTTIVICQKHQIRACSLLPTRIFDDRVL